MWNVRTDSGISPSQIRLCLRRCKKYILQRILIYHVILCCCLGPSINYILAINNSVGLRFPDKKRLSFRNLVQVPKVWSGFIHASFLIHVHQVRPFILLEFCARVDNSAKFATIGLSLNMYMDIRQVNKMKQGKYTLKQRNERVSNTHGKGEGVKILLLPNEVGKRSRTMTMVMTPFYQTTFDLETMTTYSVDNYLGSESKILEVALLGTNQAPMITVKPCKII